MEFYENGNAPENNNNDDKNKTVNPDINRDGGVFAEKDYGEEAAKMQRFSLLLTQIIISHISRR